ncbi:hypothetical protein J2S73_001970 [Amorphus orientalis]|uniref:Uncharacterized protein n=1 Tax=Amorphus orientalis TaxID=649198 RepID=A0AAE3VP87_9HYPH|nr:hypothetical protein [Amorphus orientalis]
MGFPSQQLAPETKRGPAETSPRPLSKEENEERTKSIKDLRDIDSDLDGDPKA